MDKFDHVREQIEELRKNILWNWPHLANYGEQMNQAADTLQSLLEVAEAAVCVASSWKPETRPATAIEIVPMLDRLDEALDKVLQPKEKT